MFVRAGSEMALPFLFHE